MTTRCRLKPSKGLRWILYKHPSKRSHKDKLVLKRLEKANRRIYRACVLKDEFDRFWHYKMKWAADRFIKQWCKSALLSRIEPIRDFVATIRDHYENIISFVGSRLTNAIAEGINRIIKIVKNRASGFRSAEAFIDLIYLTVGDVDIPAQIPTRFRVI